MGIDLEAIRAAREVGRGVVEHTPITPSAYLSQQFGGQVILKAENLQRTGAFKIRGAINKLHKLGSRAKSGVVAGSAGNHAGGLAFAARHFGVKSEIFIPRGASLAKISACKGYNGVVIDGGENIETAVTAAKARAAETGMAFCHPYDDVDVVAGQGTLGLELLEDIADLTQVVIPLGGGGLLAGTALAIKQHRPEVKLIGVQISSCAPYIYGDAPAGPVPTLADGIAVKQPGDVTRPLIENWVDELVDVDEDSVADAMMILLERSKMYVEGGGAVGVSALLASRVKPAKKGSTCIVLSGGNVDIGLIPNLIRRYETKAGRRALLFARISDRPGALAEFLAVVAKSGANIIEVSHVREGLNLHVRETGVQAVLEVRGPDHTQEIITVAKTNGFDVSEMVSQ
ncbi:MAG: pyridoxal-phosphate dependent enzyme [Actinobacteria bacterium]|nr:pyridoxal-phosphate dependent enzyme [Actinomycetota bacterium]